MSLGEIDINNIDSDLKDAYVDRFGSTEDLAEVYAFFRAEYLGFQGESDIQELTSTQVTDIKDQGYWDSYIQGGDPFGFHRVQLAASDDDKGLEVVWEVYSSLIQLLNAIQQSAVSLASGVEYRTKTQEAFNNKISSIDPSTGSTSAKIKKQQQIQNLRSARDVESSKAQQWSTALEAANEASSTQSQLLTAIIEQMGGIVSAIFR
ncbi:MAG: hypothetical protein ACQEP8_00445 [Chlamydiota bacterium]